MRRPNIGAASRWTRLVSGVMLLGLLWRLEAPWGLLGLPLIGSAVVGWCPLCAVAADGREDDG